MKRLLQAFKTEIDPTPEQKRIITQTIGVCRYVYNLYISHNETAYAAGEPFIDGYAFSKWLNNEYVPSHPEKAWIKDVSSKSVKQSINNACTAFKKFFRRISRFPCYKKKGKSDPKMYFVKNNPKDCISERHRIKIPTLGWVKLKEKGYIPVSGKMKSGTVSVKAGRYYVSALIELPDVEPVHPNNPGIGIDLGIKNLCVLSDERTYRNINKTSNIRKTEKRLKRAQKSLSRKYENRKKGGATHSRNIIKQRLKVQKLYQKLDNIRTDHINKTVSAIVKTKPSYVTIEDLNISNMLKNRHLSKAIAAQKLYAFKEKLIWKSRLNGIEVRIVSRWYPSSKLCHACGKLKTGLKLSERTYVCECGYTADRDYNASLNLRDATVYTVA